MAVNLRHAKVSAVADGADTSLVRPSDWNAAHVLTLDTARLLGRTSAGNGAAEEIAAGAGLTLAAASLSIAASGVVAGSYGGGALVATFTVGADGRLTAAGTASITPAGIGAAAASHTHPVSALEQSGATTGQVIKWNGSAWAPAADSTGSGGGIADAPNDGNAYVRQSEAWTNGATLYRPIGYVPAWSEITSTPTTLSGFGITDAAPAARTITAGTGLSGGGDLSANRTISLANTAVTAGSYGSATAAATFTVDAQGRLTAAGSTTVTPAWGSITSTPTTLAGYGITNGVASSRQVASGTGLTGGGDLTADRTLALTGQALAVHNLASNGVIARTGAGTVAARSIAAGANISVTNGDGVAGNPTVAVTGLATVATSGSASDITTGSLGLARLAQGGATTGQVLEWNGSAWAPATDDTGGGGLSDGDKGDITVSGSGATWTIDSGAVTLAKIQNIATARLLGRSTAGSGAPEEISIGSGLALSSGTLSATGGGFTDNWAATTDPTAGDDTADGYAVGSRWLNTTTGITWTCASASAGAAVWFPHGSIDHPGYLSGRYYIPPATNGSSQAVSSLRLYASPMPVLHRAVLTGIAFRVNTLSAGNARVAIYANDGGRPGARIAQSSVTAKASGINILSVTATLNPGFYWLAVSFSSASNIFSWTQGAVAGSAMGFFTGADNAGGVSDVFATTSTLNAIYRTAALPDLTTDFPTPFADGSSVTVAAATGAPILGIAL